MFSILLNRYLIIMSTLLNIKDRTSHYPQLIKISNDSCLAFQITADYINS